MTSLGATSAQQPRQKPPSQSEQEGDEQDSNKEEEEEQDREDDDEGDAEDDGQEKGQEEEEEDEEEKEPEVGELSQDIELLQTDEDEELPALIPQEALFLECSSSNRPCGNGCFCCGGGDNALTPTNSNGSSWGSRRNSVSGESCDSHLGGSRCRSRRGSMDSKSDRSHSISSCDSAGEISVDNIANNQPSTDGDPPSAEQPDQTVDQALLTDNAISDTAHDSATGEDQPRQVQVVINDSEKPLSDEDSDRQFFSREQSPTNSLGSGEVNQPTVSVSDHTVLLPMASAPQVPKASGRPSGPSRTNRGKRAQNRLLEEGKAALAAQSHFSKLLEQFKSENVRFQPD